MFNHLRQPGFVSAAWILISSFIISPSAASAEPSAAGAGLTLEQMASDLDQRSTTLKEESNQLAANAEAAASGPRAAEIARTRMEISRCLIQRSTMEGNKVIPTDPYYKALRRQRLADANLQMAQMWWKHCRTDTPLETVENFEDLSLAAALEEEKKKADQEIAKAKPAAPTAPDDRSRVPLNPAVMTRLKQNGSILDQVKNWENLSEESKSKIIAR